ncbi:amidohydrolase [Aliidiomarina sedimenti]|uniref:Amidohydrolase n=1 Tax=Aliidiomarina sedimenti TaxID=1933879 RepID=A0ABY0BWY5_9GAMM|nr:amidohydrolase family protein [Aliidiomarina sedimenti]RUO28847.1 amidohydrolase [Aliidiomarina sedimenti]
MKYALTLLAASVLAAPVLAHNVAPGSAQSSPVLLQGGTLHTITDGRIQGDLLFEDGKISAIGSNINLPEGTEIINIEGRHVYPGLIALDTTLGLVEMEAVRATRDANEIGNITPEVSAHTAFNADSDIIPTVRYNGITHAQVVPQGNLVRGNSSLMSLDGWNNRDSLVESDIGIHISWPQVAVSNSPWEQRSPEEQREAQAEMRDELDRVFTTARAYADAQQAGVQRRQDVRWEGMRGLFDGSKTLFIHADDRRQITQAIEFADEQGITPVIIGGRDAWMMGEELAQRNIAVVFGDAYGLPARQDDAYDTAFATPAKLAQAGVEFALAYPGFWDTRNLAFAAGHTVAFGLDHDTALYSITMAPAKLMGVDDRLGSLEVGKSASLVVSKGDILDPLEHSVDYMFIDGRAVEMSSRQTQLWDKYRERRD